MTRALRRTTVLVLVALAALLAVGVAVAETDPPAPRVTFTAPQGSCASQPNVGSLVVPQGTSVLIRNRTREDGWVWVGDEAVIGIPVGGDILLTLAPGQYEVRVVPACVTVADPAAVPVTVAVTGTATSAPASPPPTTSDPTPTSSSSVMASDPPAAPAVLPSATGASASPSVAVTVVSPRSGVIAASPVDLPEPGNPKGVRLLAILATICVLGVTAAIIRSIVRLSP